MAENLGLNLGGSIVHEHFCDSIILIDHDIASVTSLTSLTSMLEQIPYKMMSVDVASKALSMIDKQKKDIGLVIANIEMPHIDSHSFLAVLHQKDIPLILINPEIKTKETSDLLIKAARFILNKPISQNDIKNMWQHVLPKTSPWLNKINLAETQDDQIEAFRNSLKRQRISQASLLGRRPFIETFKPFEMFQKRRSIENVEWKTKPVRLIETENMREEEKNIENNVRKYCSVWTNERHMKFLDAIAILGEKKSLPKSIMNIINDPNLTTRQVSSHLQKYKAQVERISDTFPKNEWKSTDITFKYPSDLTKSLIANSFKKPSVEKKEDMLKFQLGGNLDLNSHPLCSVTNKSFMDAKYVSLTISTNPPYNIPSTNNVNHSGLVSTALSSDKLPVLSALPSHIALLTLSSEESFEFPIEDLISFDIGVNEMDIAPLMLSSEGNNGSFGKSKPLLPSHLDHDSTFNNLMYSTTHITMDHDHFPPMNLASTSHQHNMIQSCDYDNIEVVNQREKMESGKYFDCDRDCMDWIEEMLNKDA